MFASEGDQLVALGLLDIYSHRLLDENPTASTTGLDVRDQYEAAADPLLADSWEPVHGQCGTTAAPSIIAADRSNATDSPARNAA